MRRRERLTFPALLRTHPGHYALGFLFLLTSNALVLGIPWLIREAVRSLEENRATFASLSLLGAGIVGLAALQAVVRTGSRLAVLGVSRKIVALVRRRVFAHLEELPVSFFRRTPTGDILSRAINDTRQVQSLVGPGVLHGMNAIVLYVAGLVVLLQIAPGLTLLALIPYPALWIVVNQTSKRIHRYSTRVQEKLSDLSARLAENLNGIQVVKAYGREAAEVEALRGHTDGYLEANRKLIRVRSILIPVMTAMGGLATLAVLWLGGRQVVQGRLTLGDFALFQAYLGLMVWPTISLGWIVNVFQRGKASLERLGEFLDQPWEALPEEEHEPLGEVRGEIELRDLTAGPEGDEGFRLRGISARVPAGSVLGIVGRVGSGKTILLEALGRLIPVEPGQILLDGRDVTTIHPRELRRRLGFVPQDAFLFSTSLRRNLAYALPDPDAASEEEIRRAAQIAQLAHDVDGFPRGFETRLGERGITLSGGQRQRATIARALVAGPDVLVMDDSMSSVDTETEREILRGLREARRGRTLLLVSHRISAVRDADQVLVLEEGTVTERGTHEELLTTGGLYSRLWEEQRLADELEAEE